MFNWFKKKVESVESTQIIPASEVSQPSFSALDYPSKEYKAYWETYLVGNTAEVRFMKCGRDLQPGDNPVHEIHSVTAPTQSELQRLIEKLVVEKMPNFKR
jgi:hypothetical protein